MLLIVLLLTVGGVLDGQLRKEAPVRENPFVGRWIANLSKSRPHPDFKFQRVTLQIDVAGDTVKMASVVVDPNGKERRAAETFRSDGTETPGTLTPGVTHIARFVGSHVLATIANKDGELFAMITYEVSADGKTLRSRSSGMLEQVIVFDRQP
jgi:hypothetical protein